MPDPQDPPVVIAELENGLEAQLLSALLEEAGIAHRIRVYHDSASAGLFSLARPWGAVEAPAGRRERVLKLLDAVRRGGGGSLPDTHPVPEPVS